VLSAAGVWKSIETGITANEPTRILVIIHSPSSLVESSIDSIRSEYMLRFHQEAVLKVSTQASASFK
jgi:hypothetical protein